ncbi:MAG TPA: AEC family transporter, partial [Gammaproteobacteria bacterium]|nr:AEC family transporter [Gammaproteobacteria bacterium]
LIMNVAGPCLIVDSLSHLTMQLGDFLTMVLASIAMLGAMIAAGFAILKAVGLPIRSFLPALAIGNTGNLGLPLCLFAFGQRGLGLAVAVYVTNSVGQFIVTPMLQSGMPAFRTLAATPVAYAAAIGVVLLAAGLHPPEWLATTLRLLGDLMIPLMLLALGNTLGGLKVTRLGLAVGIAGARLALGVAAAFGVGKLVGLDGLALAVLVLQGAMPTAVFNYLFAARYERHPDDVAGIVLVSTLLVAVLLPWLVTYVLALAG